MNNNQLIIYKTEDGQVKIEIHFENETVWLTQAQIGELFQKSKATISEHITNIFKDGELEEKLVVRDFRTTTQHGAVKGLTQTKNVKHYNLDVVISVGYRVKSHRGVHLRKWATDSGNSITMLYLTRLLVESTIKYDIIQKCKGLKIRSLCWIKE